MRLNYSSMSSPFQSSFLPFPPRVLTLRVLPNTPPVCQCLSQRLLHQGIQLLTGRQEKILLGKATMLRTSRRHHCPRTIWKWYSLQQYHPGVLLPVSASNHTNRSISINERLAGHPTRLSGWLFQVPRSFTCGLLLPLGA